MSVIELCAACEFNDCENCYELDATNVCCCPRQYELDEERES